MQVLTKLTQTLHDAIMARGAATLVVCGGSSPLALFAGLQDADIDRSRVTVTLVDDRLVPADDENSNQRLLHQHLLVGPVKQARFMPLDHQIVDLPRPFDVMLLGMGPDGHFASLFPDMVGDPAAFDPVCAPAVITTPPLGNPCLPRISMNMAMILQSRLIVMLVRGDEKRAVYEQAKTDRSLPLHWLFAQTQKAIDVEFE